MRFNDTIDVKSWGATLHTDSPKKSVCLLLGRLLHSAESSEVHCSIWHNRMDRCITAGCVSCSIKHSEGIVVVWCYMNKVQLKNTKGFSAPELQQQHAHFKFKQVTNIKLGLQHIITFFNIRRLCKYQSLISFKFKNKWKRVALIEPV